MPKRDKSRRMKGGFLESLSNTLSSGWNSVSQGASSAWDKTKNAASSAYLSATSPATPIPATPIPAAPIPPPAPIPSSPLAGGKKRKSKKMRGGYASNTTLTGLSASASPISGIKTAQPHNWVGGRTKRRRTKCHRCNSKSCRYNSKSCRHRK